MPIAAWITVSIAAGAIGAALVWGLVVGDLRVEGAALLDMPWGVVSLVEIYVGMVLFAGWVLWREASAVRASSWLVAAARK